MGTKKIKMVKMAQVRKRRGYSQKALAEKLGMSSDTISMYERGVRNPSLNNIIKIAKALDCEIYEIV